MLRDKELPRGALAGMVAALATVVAIAMLRLAAGVPLPLELASDRFLPMLPVSGFLLLLKLTGGPLVSKQLAFFAFFAGTVVVGAALGVFYAARAGPRPGRRAVLGVSGAVLAAWAVTVAVLSPALASSYRGIPAGGAAWLSGVSLLAEYAVFGAVLVVAHAAETRPARLRPAGQTMDRATLLVRAAGGAALLASSGLVGWLYSRSTFGYDGTTTTGPDLAPVTPTDRFYVVTKNFVDPRVDESAWRFEIRGLVERPRSYDLHDVETLPGIEQEMTLECISNKVGGGLISNARWKGVRLRDLLAAAGPRPEAAWLLFAGADGYTHSVELATALKPGALLAYEMNGAALPFRHGYPARVLLPGGYGELNVKWVQRMDVRAERAKGYYERQGWRAYRVHTMSRIDFPRKGSPVRAREEVNVRGVAFAGDRGVRGVEVSVDGGKTWADAAIDFPGTELTWVLWSFAWRPNSPGDRVLAVRATDGEGMLQEAGERGVNPSGAAGYHRVPVRVA